MGAASNGIYPSHEAREVVTSKLAHENCIKVGAVFEYSGRRANGQADLILSQISILVPQVRPERARVG